MLNHSFFTKNTLVSLLALVAVLGTSQEAYAMEEDEHKSSNLVRTAPQVVNDPALRAECSALAVKYKLVTEEKNPDEAILSGIMNLGDDRDSILEEGHNYKLFQKEDDRKMPSLLSVLDALEILKVLSGFDDRESALSDVRGMQKCELFPLSKDDWIAVAHILNRYNDTEHFTIFLKLFKKYNLTRLFSNEFMYIDNVMSFLGDRVKLLLEEDFRAKIGDPNKDYDYTFFFEKLEGFCKRQFPDKEQPKAIYEDSPYQGLILTEDFIQTYVSYLAPIFAAKEEDRFHRTMLHEFIRRPETRDKTVEIVEKTCGKESAFYKLTSSKADRLSYYQEIDQWLLKTPPFTCKWPQVSEFMKYKRTSFQQASQWAAETKVLEKSVNLNVARSALHDIMMHLEKDQELPSLELVTMWIEKDNARHRERPIDITVHIGDNKVPK